MAVDLNFITVPVTGNTWGLAPSGSDLKDASNLQYCMEKSKLNAGPATINVASGTYYLRRQVSCAGFQGLIIGPTAQDAIMVVGRQDGEPMDLLARADDSSDPLQTVRGFEYLRSHDIPVVFYMYEEETESRAVDLTVKNIVFRNQHDLKVTNPGGSLPVSGYGNSISAPSSGVQTLSDAEAAFPASMSGMYITIEGATNPENNGTFPITARLSATQVSYTNPAGVVEASYTGFYGAERPTRGFAGVYSSNAGAVIHISGLRRTNALNTVEWLPHVSNTKIKITAPTLLVDNCKFITLSDGQAQGYGIAVFDAASHLMEDGGTNNTTIPLSLGQHHGLFINRANNMSGRAASVVGNKFQSPAKPGEGCAIIPMCPSVTVTNSLMNGWSSPLCVDHAWSKFNNSSARLAHYDVPARVKASVTVKGCLGPTATLEETMFQVPGSLAKIFDNGADVAVQENVSLSYLGVYINSTPGWASNAIERIGGDLTFTDARNIALRSSYVITDNTFRLLILWDDGGSHIICPLIEGLPIDDAAGAQMRQVVLARNTVNAFRAQDPLPPASECADWCHPIFTGMNHAHVLRNTFRVSQGIEPFLFAMSNVVIQNNELSCDEPMTLSMRAVLDDRSRDNDINFEDSSEDPQVAHSVLDLGQGNKVRGAKRLSDPSLMPVVTPRHKLVLLKPRGLKLENE